jgi:uncharacterized protein (DUF488 family)
MAEPFYTVGHSNRTISEFVDLLKEADISLVADVRSIPKSRANPQYNRDVLPRALCAFQIGYEHIAALGGRRARSHAILPEVNAFWDNQSFHNYADYAMSDEFDSGFAKLRGVAQTARCAIMCAEVLWWRCHRRIIADYLIAAGEDVLHILGLHKIETAQITGAARVGSAGMLTYPSAKQGENRDAGAIAASRP